MAKRLLDDHGRVIGVEFTSAELAQLFSVSEDKLKEWVQALPPAGADETGAIYRFTTQDSVKRARKLVAILRTGMASTDVLKIEEEGMLDAYAGLSQDSPEGITAHCWRSYSIIVLMQVRYGKMLDAAELAVRARLHERSPLTGEIAPSEELAKRHLRLLQAVGALQHGGDRWIHKGLPHYLSGKQA